VSSPAGTVVATYQYNALGQRVQASGSGVGSNPVFQYYDAFGNLAYHGDLTTWGYAPFPPVAGKVYGKYYGRTLFIHSNALGSTGTTTWQDGTWGNSEIYDPWGQRWATSGSLLDERFAGIDNVRDPESGLDQTPFRMLTSSYGRWMSPDPLAGDVTNPQSLNRYAYVLNNPTNLVDPLGLQGQEGGGVWTGNCTPYGYTSGCNWGGGATSNTMGMNASGGCMAGEYGCAGTPSEMQIAEANHDTRVELAFLKARGYNFGTDQNGTVYLWMAGSQITCSNDGASVGCGKAVKGQWTKLSDLDYESQVILSQQMVGFESGSMTDSRMYAGWMGASAATAAFALYGPAAYTGVTVFAATNPAVWGCAMDFVQGFISPPGASTSWCGAVGQAVSGAGSSH
jgi:RHS repeat-associated protein